MAPLLGRRDGTTSRRKSQFQKASEGSMPLMEHLRELRNRLFKAAIGIVAGMIVGLFFAKPVQEFLNAPYCDFKGVDKCDFATGSPIDPFLLKLRIALYLGILLSSPIWLYQLWAFIAPGLHKHERKYTYYFTAAAVPLFFAGAFLAHFVVAKSLKFFLATGDNFTVMANLTGYFDFVTGMMLLFGAAFEFPLIVVMLNFVGLVTARKLLGYWRMAIFLMFLFSAIVTPTPDPFGMSALGGAMAILYFGAIGVAALNDRRRARKAREEGYEGLDDDDASPLEHKPEPVAEPTPVDDRHADAT